MNEQEKNNEKNSNDLNSSLKDENVDFDAMFDEEDIATWGSDLSNIRIATVAMHK